MSNEPNCPHCGEPQTDLWDYDWGNREQIKTECGDCGKPVIIARDVSVAYEVTLPKTEARK